MTDLIRTLADDEVALILESHTDDRAAYLEQRARLAARLIEFELEAG